MSVFALAGCAAAPSRSALDVGPFLVPLSEAECVSLGDDCIRFRLDAWEMHYLRNVIGITPKDEDQ